MKMKNITPQKTFQTIVFLVLCVFLSGHSYAEVWTDSFDGNELIGWERIWNGNPHHVAHWEVVEGFLLPIFGTLISRQVVIRTQRIFCTGKLLILTLSS